MAPENLHTVLIEKLVPGGLGLARLKNGIVVLTPYVLPGEKVLVRENKRKKDFIAATLQEIILPSPDRINPPCPLYNRCGGCDLQHANYDTQILLKKNILSESLLRSAGNIFTTSETSIHSTIASPRTLGYRQRLRLQVDREGQYGFFRSGSHDLEPVVKCFLAMDELNVVLGQLPSCKPFKELIRQCNAFELLMNPGTGEACMLLHFLRKPRPKDSLLAAETVNDINGLSTILMQVESYGLYDPLVKEFASRPYQLSQVVSPDRLNEEIMLTWEAGGFCQVNPGQNYNLINLVLEILEKGPHKRVLDLYCGYGNFSLPVAKLAGEVVGIDSQNAAIRSGKRNAELNRAHNCHFVKQQVQEGVSSLLGKGEKFDTVILDPPRQGAAEIVSGLAGLGAQQVIYISCNPATLTRDLAVLCRNDFKLSHLIPVDMFPQTHHMESVALLRRNRP